MKKYLLLIRGCPGAGKSYYARRVMKKFDCMFNGNIAYCSADKYFINDAGVYTYNREKIGAAHEECKNKAAAAMLKGIDLVILDNTNTTKKELNPYIEMANKYGYTVKYKVVGGASEEDIKKYAARNIHGVSEETIRKMAQRLVSSLNSKED